MDDKRYRECVAEITAVLQKHDMAGAITVVSQERAMFKYVFPSWSCITLDGNQLRFRAKRADYPDRGEHQQAIELSAHIIMQIRDIAAQTFGMFELIGKQLEEQVGLE